MSIMCPFSLSHCRERKALRLQKIMFWPAKDQLLLGKRLTIGAVKPWILHINAGLSRSYTGSVSCIIRSCLPDGVPA